MKKVLSIAGSDCSGGAGIQAAYYDAFRAARQEINSGVVGMEVQGGFDARA